MDKASVITVNGVPIGEEAIAAEVQYHQAASLEEARQAAAQALVVKQILLQEADRLGIQEPPGSEGDEPAEETRIRLLMEQRVKVPEPDKDANSPLSLPSPMPSALRCSPCEAW